MTKGIEKLIDGLIWARDRYTTHDEDGSYNEDKAICNSHPRKKMKHLRKMAVISENLTTELYRLSDKMI